MDLEQRLQSLPAELFNHILNEVRTFSNGRVLLSNDTSKQREWHIQQWQGPWVDFADANVIKAFPELREEYFSTKTFMIGPMDFGTSACFTRDGLNLREDLRLWKEQPLSSAFHELAQLEVYVLLVESARRNLSDYYSIYLDGLDNEGSSVMWWNLCPIDLYRTTLPNLKHVTLDCRQCLPDDDPPRVSLTQIRRLGFRKGYQHRWPRLESASLLTINPKWASLIQDAMHLFESFTTETEDDRLTRIRISL